MPVNTPTVSMSRKVTGFALLVEFHPRLDSLHSQEAFQRFLRVTTSSLSPECWPDVERMLATMVDDLQSIDRETKERRSGEWLAERRASRVESVIGTGVPWQVRKDGEVWSMAPIPGVNIRIASIYHRREFALRITFTFEDTQKATGVYEAFKKVHGEVRIFGEVNITDCTWEPALYLKPRVSDDWLFDGETAVLLGERISKVPGANSWSDKLTRLAPLEGEQVVVYRSVCGLHADADAPPHPDGAFASIGKLALYMKYDEVLRTRHIPRDRVVAKFDERLPLPAPTPREERFTDDDVEGDVPLWGWRDEE
jgi:hypothetical protein